MLQLLPGGQAYLDAAAPSGAHSSRQSAMAENLEECRTFMAYSCASALNHVMQQLLYSASRDWRKHGKQWIDKDAPILSAAAVRLVLELQLLAAAELQRETVRVLLSCNALLTAQIKALAQIGYRSGSSLPPEVLQQAGLQLLQALAAPLQQLQLCSADDWLSGLPSAGGSTPCSGALGAVPFKPLYVLRAATSGFEGGEPCNRQLDTEVQSMFELYFIFPLPNPIHAVLCLLYRHIKDRKLISRI
jgi:hypothetical protein